MKRGSILFFAVALLAEDQELQEILINDLNIRVETRGDIKPIQ